MCEWRLWRTKLKLVAAVVCHLKTLHRQNWRSLNISSTCLMNRLIGHLLYIYRYAIVWKYDVMIVNWKNIFEKRTREFCAVIEDRTVMNWVFCVIHWEVSFLNMARILIGYCFRRNQTGPVLTIWLNRWIQSLWRRCTPDRRHIMRACSKVTGSWL